MMKTISKTPIFALSCAVALVGLVGQGTLLADEAEDSLKEGLKAYQGGNYAEATKSIQYALSLINEKKADAALAALPKTIGGWEGDKGEAQSLGMLGGGTVVTRTYKKDNNRAKISLTMDSPLVQQMMGLITNPMFAGQMGRPRKVNGQDATYNKDNGELTMVIDNRILLKVEASGAEEEDVLGLAKAIDLDALKTK